MKVTERITSTAKLVWSLGLAMLLFCFAPVHAQSQGFKSTSAYQSSASVQNPNTVNQYNAYRSTIYQPFSESAPSNNGPSSGPSKINDRRNAVIGIPGWGDTMSEPLPITDGTLFLLLIAATMITIIAIKQRKQKQLQSITTNNNNNPTQHMTTRKQTYQSFFQKLFLLLAFVCVAGQVSGQQSRRVYFRPSTILVSNNKGSSTIAWAKASTGTWFPMLGNKDNVYDNRKWHYLDTYTSVKIYNGDQSRFLAYTADTDTYKFAFYRINDNSGGTINTTLFKYVTQQGSTANVDKGVFNCIPNNDWYTKSGQYWNSQMISLPDLGAHNLICIKEGSWTSYYYAYYIDNTVNLYFANTTNWDTPIFARGKDVYSYKHSSTNITGTKLYYTQLAKLSNIAYTDYAYIDGNTGSWTEQTTLWKDYETQWVAPSTINQNTLENRIKGFSKRSAIVKDHCLDNKLFENSTEVNFHVFTPGTNVGDPLTKQSLSNYTDLNYTLTVKTYSAVKHTANTLPTYNDDNNNTNGGTIEYSAYKLSGQRTSVLTEGSSSTASTDITAAYTGTIVLTAVPKTGYKFVGWYSSTGDLLSTELKWTTEKTKGNTTIHARFMSYNKQIRMQTYGYDQKSQTYKWLDVADGGKKITITYNDGTGNKTEEKTTAATLSIYPQEGTTVQLSAVAKNNYTFVGWWDNNGQRYDNNPWSFLPEETNQSITARFAPSRQQTINVHTYDNEQDTYVLSGNGGYVNIAYTQLTTTVNDGYITTNTDVTTQNTYTALHNTSVTLTAKPKSSYAFLGWYEGENKVGSNTTYTYTATTERNITARFHKPFTQAFDVQTEIGGQYQNSTTGGTATISYNNTTTNLTDQVLSISNMGQGTMVTLKATPNDGYRFVGWYNGSGALDSSSPTYTYRAEGSRTVHARFARNDIQLVVAVMNYNTDYAEFVEYPHDNNTVTIANGGNTTTVTSSTSAIVNYGSQVTLTANNDKRDDGYDFIGWYQNNKRISQDTSYTFTITDHSAISAHFAPEKCHKVRIKASLGGIYTVKYAREKWFDTEGMYYTATSQYDNDIEIYVPYEAQISVINPQPIHGYKYLGYKVLKGVKDANKDVYTIQTYDPINPPTVLTNFVRTDEQVIYLDISNKDVASTKWNGVTNFGCNRRTNFKEINKLEPGSVYFEEVRNSLLKVTIEANAFEYVTIHQKEDAVNCSTGRLAIPSTRYNCYKLNAYQSSTGEWVDAWTTVDTENGDYRLIYIEQEVTSKTEITRTYEFNEGDRIKKVSSGNKTDIVSLHIYNKVSKDNNGNLTGTALNNPEIILQQWNGTTWVDIERHMVFGPLQTDNTNNIRMPGRKNTVQVVVDKGIDAIKAEKNNATKDYGSGVWNFHITQENGNVKLELDKTEKYTGKYYIRTTNADGQYHNFTHPNNVMTPSEYAKKYSDFSHYFVRYVDIYEDGTPTATAGKHPVVKFTIANDHAMFLCKELMINNNRFTDDEYEDDPFVVNKGGAPNLPADASVRFGWDIKTNRLTRAYIASTFQKNNEYLVVEGTNIGTPSGDDTYFTDNSNWLYTIDLDATKNAAAKVKAKMNGKYQYFMGAEKENQTLISGNGANTYPIRLLYDFKDDRFTTIYRPSGQLNGDISVNTPLMIEREHNNAPTQIQLTTNTVTSTGTGEDQYTQPAYAVMTFLESVLANNEKTHHEKMFYWVSFPFDVKISDVFGLGDYGQYWIMQYYDGAQRAASGLAQTNWKYILDTEEILDANKGYIICLNYNQILQDQLFKSYGGSDKTLNSGKLSLYFPSNSIVSPAAIKQQDPVVVNLDAHPIGANIAWNHWNWHVIGVPSYANPTFSTTQGDVPFFYQYWHPTDGYAAVASTEVKFYAMHSYMVQYAGKIEWSKIVNTAPQSLAARRDAAAEEHVMLRLELQQEGNMLDKTYVQLRSDKGTLGFDLNLDLSKVINAGANIYSVVNGDQMAGNAIPKEETVIPIGVVITTAGNYTFAMPNGTGGMIVELIDYEQGTSTNLLAMDYTVNLPKATNNTRFALRLKPNKVATSVENIGNGTTSGDAVRKLLIDGVLYLQQGNTLYDAQGRYVQ